METPLLQSVELENYIIIGDVIKNHQSFMNNGQSIDSNKLIEILGGSDAILQHYLSSNNLSQLTSQQLQDINNLLIPSKSDDTNSILSTGGASSLFSILSTEKSFLSPVLSISLQHTLLHQIFGVEFGNTIVGMIFGRKVFSFVVFVLFGWLAVWLLFAIGIIGYGEISYITSSITMYSVMFMYATLILFAMNKQTTKLILKSFEFWYKVLHFIRFWICSSIYYGAYVKSYMFYDIYYNGTIFMTILAFCLIDGLRMTYKVRTILTILCASIFTFDSIYWTFLYTDSRFVELHLGTYSVPFDMKEWAASSMRVLTLFVWKQTIYGIFKASKSSIIQTPVRIVWS